MDSSSVPDPKLRYVYTPGMIKTQDANGDCIDRYTYTDFGTTPAKSALDALREVSGMRLHGSGSAIEWDPQSLLALFHTKDRNDAYVSFAYRMNKTKPYGVIAVSRPLPLAGANTAFASSLSSAPGGKFIIGYGFNDAESRALVMSKAYLQSLFVWSPFCEYLGNLTTSNLTDIQIPSSCERTKPPDGPNAFGPPLLSASCAEAHLRSGMACSRADRGLVVAFAFLVACVILVLQALAVCMCALCKALSQPLPPAAEEGLRESAARVEGSASSAEGAKVVPSPSFLPGQIQRSPSSWPSEALQRTKSFRSSTGLAIKSVSHEIHRHDSYAHVKRQSSLRLTYALELDDMLHMNMEDDIAAEVRPSHEDGGLTKQVASFVRQQSSMARTSSRFSSVAAEAVARGREARANDAAEADSTTPRRFSLSALISPRSTRQEETSDPLGVKTPREFKRAPLEQQLETLDECIRSKAVCSSRNSKPIIDVGASQASERDSAVESSSRSSGASEVPPSTITSITESAASSGRASGREVGDSDARGPSIRKSVLGRKPGERPHLPGGMPPHIAS